MGLKPILGGLSVFHHKSFSQKSFSKKSWKFNLVELAIKYAKQLFVKASANYLVATTKDLVIRVKQRGR